jgi:hypothetical protein
MFHHFPHHKPKNFAKFFKQNIGDGKQTSENMLKPNAEIFVAFSLDKLFSTTSPLGEFCSVFHSAASSRNQKEYQKRIAYVA